MTPPANVAHYHITGKLGAGGMGEVYRATDTKLGREVAIKMLPEAFAQDAARMARFEREAQVLASLNHPNIAAIYGIEQGALVMELVEGEDLRGPVPLDTALDYARQIAAGLEAAHEKGIIHRDLKPANIKVTPSGVVKLLDFGLASVTANPSQEAGTTVSMTQAGVILGTAGYMSPEQARGQAVDKRADIWAFGVVLYELTTGERLFQGQTLSDSLAAVLKEEPRWDRAPQQVQRLLRACLEKDPKQRLHDIADARLLLEETYPAQVRRGAMPWILAGVMVAAGAIGLLSPWRAVPPVPETLRFQIQPATNVTLRGTFAVSPDGRRLAYGGAGPDGVSRLWVRALHSLEERMLPGTEMESVNPPFFWSPDSRFIAFQSAGKLKKVDVSGGSPQVLSELSGVAIGGAWNRDGVILIGNSSGGILRLPAGGGPVTAVTRLDEARQETLHVFPVFLGDGKHFLHMRGAATMENSGIYIGSLDAKLDDPGVARRLLPPPSVAHVPGRLLFVRGGTLFAQEFDERRYELKGEPVAVAGGVGVYLGYPYFSVSENGVLVHRSGGSESLQPTWFDRQGKVLGKAGEPGRYNGFALSPDGTRVVMSRTDPQNPTLWDLWMLDFARGTNPRFTFGSVRADSPVWSPDGARIVYTSAGGSPNNLYQKLANGAKEEEVLLKSNEWSTPTSWSKDGKRLLFTVPDPKTADDVWMLPLEGEAKPVRILGTAFGESEARFSPDMRWIAYTSNESGKPEVYVRGFNAADPASDGGGKWMVSKGGGSRAQWRGDGREIFYIVPDGTVMSVTVGAGPAFQAGVPQILFQLPPGTGRGDVTADGNRFLFAVPVEQSMRAPFTVVLNWMSELKQ